MKVYKQRYFTALNNWQIDDEIILKPYFISPHNPIIEDGLLLKAKKHVRQNLSLKLPKDKHNKAGYVIIHQGEMGVWLLVHWWAYEDIVLSTLSNAKSPADEFINFDNKPFHACVWEHVVINHERDAWIENVMCAESNIDNYLADRLKDGKY